MKPITTTATARQSFRTSEPLTSGTPRSQRVAVPLKVEDILVPTDFSKPSEAALKYAIAFARQIDAKITLLYVVEPLFFTDFEDNPLVMDNDQATARAREKLESLKLQLGDDARYIGAVKAFIGKPFQEITSYARGSKADLIILATHGRTGLKHVLLGSTAEKVVRHSACPVLVVRDGEPQVVRPQSAQ